MPVYYFGTERELTKAYFRKVLIEQPPSVIALDTETISLTERLPIGFSIALNSNDSFYFPTYPEHCPEIELVKPLLRNPNILKVYHNALFDLRAFPLILDGMDSSNIFDTNVAAHLLNYEETSLEVLAPQVGMYTINAKDFMTLRSAKVMTDCTEADVAKKCCDDARVTYRLWQEFRDKVDKDYFDIEMKAIPILNKMSLRGLRINQRDRGELAAKLGKEVEYYRKLCEEEYSFNPGSFEQVGYILAQRGNWLPFNRQKKNPKTGKWSKPSVKTGDEFIRFLDDPLAQIIRLYRHVSKLKSTYLDPLENQDRAYTYYNLEAIVGRISSSGQHDRTAINMQNIPVEEKFELSGGISLSIRNIFMPDSGVFTTGDLSQEHLRIIMHLADEPAMRRVYEDGDMGGDIHTATAVALFGNSCLDESGKRAKKAQRNLAKIVNYAIPYGGTADVLHQNSGLPVARCQEFLNSWFKTFRRVEEWIREAKAYGSRTGFAPPTLFGRGIRVPEEWQYDELNVESMARKFVNYPIIGTDGEVMKRALVICKEAGLEDYMAVTVHDSLTFDGDVKDKIPIEAIEHILPVRIPFEISQTLRWE